MRLHPFCPFDLKQNDKDLKKGNVIKLRKHRFWKQTRCFYRKNPITKQPQKNLCDNLIKTIEKRAGIC